MKETGWRVYKDKNSTFNKLLGEDGSVSAVKMFKVSRGLSPEIINEIFQYR